MQYEMSCKCGKMVLITIIFMLGLITGFLITMYMLSDGKNRRTIKVADSDRFEGGNNGITVESITISGPQELLYDDYVAEYYKQQGGLVPMYVADKAVMTGISMIEKIVTGLFRGMQNNLFALNMFGDIMLNTGRAAQMDGILGNNNFSSIMNIFSQSTQYSELVRGMIDWGTNNMRMNPMNLISSVKSWITKINLSDFASLPKLGAKIIIYTLIDAYRQYKPHLLMWFGNFSQHEIFALQRAFAVKGKIFVDVDVMIRELIPALLESIRPDNIEQICDIVFMSKKKTTNPDEFLNNVDSIAGEIGNLIADAFIITDIAKRLFRKQEFNDRPCNNFQEFYNMSMQELGYQRQFQY